MKPATFVLAFLMLGATGVPAQEEQRSDLSPLHSAPDSTSSTALLRLGSGHSLGPNPYYAYNAWATSSLRPFVTFNNLPPRAVIRIYNLAGHLVRTLQKDSDSQFFEWDLRNEDHWLVASGMYICHIELPDLNLQRVLKLAVIQENPVPD